MIAELDPRRPADCRRLILMPPRAPAYPLHLSLDERRLRMLMEWESCEALRMAKEAGLEKL